MQLAALAGVLFALTGRVGSASGEEGRARKDRAGRAAGTVTADRGIHPRARMRHDDGCHQIDRSQPQHTEAALP